MLFTFILPSIILIFKLILTYKLRKTTNTKALLHFITFYSYTRNLIIPSLLLRFC
nr:MAG TPA: hypothetical protein [Caudoviricetes sp.]